MSKFIELYCGDENLVPNVVHYVWCKKHELGFFHFLSFMSALRFIKPCLILFHGDFLPFGKYWNFFISDFHRVIHVQRKCPDGFGFLEHASDVMRIEALMGKCLLVTVFGDFTIEAIPYYSFTVNVY